MSGTMPLDDLVAALRAAGEETRLRILLLLAEGDLNVSDLTEILGQSQPRISRHLKLLVDAGLVARHREGAWAFFRLADGASGGFARIIAATLKPNDRGHGADQERLAAVRAARAQQAQTYFASQASIWDRVRSLHAPETAVEAEIRALAGERPVNALLDLGTGTGRMLALLAPLARRAVGVDANHAMLAVARANLEKAGLARAELRQGDILAPPVERNAFDLVVIHQVLHYLEDPARALKEAASHLAPGGRLLLVDFAPHNLEFLREGHAHRRLGLSHDELGGWIADAGLDQVEVRDLAPPRGDEGKLTVTLWLAKDRRVAADWPLQAGREVA